MWVSEKVLRNGKPIARSGRKATDLSEMAGLPKSNLLHGNHLLRACAVMVLAETIMQHHSDYQSGPIGPALLGSSGRNWNHLGRDSQPDARPEIIAIQKCRADLQAFLQRTRTRLARIADSAGETCEDHLEQAENSRIFRGADGSQPLKPLPILAPSLKQNCKLAPKTSSRSTANSPLPMNSPWSFAMHSSYRLRRHTSLGRERLYPDSLGRKVQKQRGLAVSTQTHLITTGKWQTLLTDIPTMGQPSLDTCLMSGTVA